ncbi:pectate lyase family protein [Actinoplanes auranticolor]|uniref:Pectate lyase n=1 Tax=Actinoplanes auranticolor TaxID=47988 RepID=A0A919SW51_9ACTN|nr:pectate lyase [Actinoplanes auranticolor]GIM79950.1 pectate lyase [Actinoplanes auranticolor]
MRTRLLAAVALAAVAVVQVPSTQALAAPATADGFASVAGYGHGTTTGGAGGPTVTVSTQAAFLAAIAQPGPLIIQVSGAITLPTGSRDGMHDVTSDKTVVGLGSTGALVGGGLNIGLPVDDDLTTPPANAVHNVIIRNLRLTGATDDLINVQMFSHHVWIDHNDFSDGDDGALDIKRGSDLVTVSWNRFHDHDKTLLLGHDDDGVASTNDAGLFVEGNYFFSVNNPGRVDFSGPLGRMVQRDNILVECNHAIEVRGTVTDPRTFYAYTADSASSVPTIVPAGAGTGKV